MTAIRLLAAALAVALLASSTPADESAPVPPSEAAGRMTLPEGFRVTLFAGEPDVRQPIAFTIDPRGRLWVAECYSYPQWTDGAEGKDRILIFEDADGDGHFDKRTVFADKVPNVSGLLLGFGGAWVCSTPHLIFIPDRDGDDVPDGAPEVKLDGWNLKQAQHNVLNALIWGPDGWLYGCNGIQSRSKVGKPGTPEAERVDINCGVWRYHPTRGTFEVVAHGTTNPWGLDFDDYGEAFITNCVIPHLFRVVPGAHFQRMYGQDYNPHLYGLMESCADHLHWAGGRWQDSREGKGKHGEAGGGHAHVGAMVYLGDNWPDAYRNSVFMCNVHGRRVNRDTLERRGSGYVARHGRDFLMANDPWFRGLELKYGPDGAVYLTDWSDTGECHEFDADGAHRENGRIYKITYGSPRPAKVDLARLSDAELVALQTHKNDWYVRTARRLLQDRGAAGKDMAGVHKALRDLFASASSTPRRLRALWALFVTGGLDESALLDHLRHEDDHIRAWSVRLLGDGRAPSPAAVDRFVAMAKDDPSPLVRLYLASTFQRVPVESRWGVAEALAAHGEDASDPALPLMVWYAIEPMAEADLARAADLATQARLPLVRRHIARRIASAADPSAGLEILASRLARADDPEIQGELIAGMLEALRSRKGVRTPEGWAAASAALARSPRREVREQATLLALRLGDPEAVIALRRAMMDPTARPEWRRQALLTLVEARTPWLSPDLRWLLDDPALRGPAIRALAAYEDEETPPALAKRYRDFTEEEKADAIVTLAARPATAKDLLDAVAAGTVPRRDLSATVARQLLAFGDPVLARRLEEVWGTIRPTSGAKAALTARYKALLTPDALKSADPSRGRAVFNRTCLQCHRLYDAGGDVGPDLTGSDRASVDYILENVLDPSSAVGRDYRLTTVATTDGRLLEGIVREQSPTSLTLQTANERLILPREDIEDVKVSDASMMPEGLFEKLSDEEVRDLVAYLASKEQVPLPGNGGRDKIERAVSERRAP